MVKLCRRALLCLLLALLAAAAFATLVPRAAAASARETSALPDLAAQFDRLYIDGTESTVDATVCLGKEGTTYFVTGDTHTYRLAGPSYFPNLDLYSAEVAGVTHALEPLPPPEDDIYVFELGTHTGDVAIRLGYRTDHDEVYHETIYVRTMSESETQNVWYAAQGWQYEDGTFSANSAAGELTLALRDTPYLRAEVHADGGQVTAATGGERQTAKDGEPLSLPASDELRIVTLTYEGNGAASVVLTESDPVFLSLSYAEELGTVTAQGKLLAAGDHRYERGASLSVSFSPAPRVPSALLPAEEVACIFEGYTLNGTQGNETSLFLPLDDDITLDVRFIQCLPAVPLGGEIVYTDAAGERNSLPFTDGAQLTLTSANDPVLTLPALGIGERCTVTDGGKELSLPQQNGLYRYPFTPDERARRITVTYSREGYHPAALSFTVRKRAVASVTLAADNRYERVYNADGALENDFSLFAEVRYADGEIQRIPLTYTDTPNAYVFESRLYGEAIGFTADVTLYTRPAAFARLIQNEETLPETAENAASLYKAFRALLEGRTPEEAAYAHSILPAARIAARVLTAASPVLHLSADAAWEELPAVLESLFEKSELYEEDRGGIKAFVTIDGEQLAKENFSALFKGGEHPVFISYEGQTARAGILYVPAKRIRTLPFTTSFSYTGEPILPFLQDEHIAGLLPSAADDCILAEYTNEDGEQVPAIVEAGVYQMTLKTRYSAQYAFAEDAKTQFTVTVGQKDISNFIKINGVSDGDTLIIEDDFAVYAEIDGYNVKFVSILEHGGISTSIEIVRPQDTLSEGSYRYRVVVNDRNFCGEAQVTFSVAHGASEQTAALCALLERLAAASRQEKMSVFLEIRAVLSEMDDAALARAMQDAAFAEAFSACNEAWHAFTAQAYDDLSQISAAFSPTAASLAAAAAAVAAGLALALGKFTL